MNNDEKREQEVLKCLKSSNRTNDMVCIFPKTDLMKIMIKALEEIQQYRAIGTPDELLQLKENGAFTGAELAQLVVMQMRLKEYQAIGTPEECREAMERQTAYDVDKVVEQISALPQYRSGLADAMMQIQKYGNESPMIRLDNVIEIVRGTDG